MAHIAARLAGLDTRGVSLPRPGPPRTRAQTIRARSRVLATVAPSATLGGFGTGDSSALTGDLRRRWATASPGGIDRQRVRSLGGHPGCSVKLALDVF